jgi:hypothetical protein
MRFTAAKGEMTEEFGRISNEAIETYYRYYSGMCTETEESRETTVELKSWSMLMIDISRIQA